jgi:hypothetical protein
VHGRDGPFRGIGDQDRQAIGGSNSQHDSRPVGNQRIALAKRGSPISQQYDIGMNLSKSCDFRVYRRPLRAGSGSKTMRQPGEILQRLRQVHSAVVNAKQTQF